MPLRAGPSWQQRQATAYDLSHFPIDWQAQRVTCPQDKRSAAWCTSHDKQGQPRLEVMFNKADGGPGPARPLWTQSKRQRRQLTFRPQAEHEALTAARTSQQTDAFKAR